VVAAGPLAGKKKRKKGVRKMRLGQQVKKLRKSLKLTQKEFASPILGRGGYTYIGKIERGYQYPSVRLLEKTARAYGVPVLYFFLEEPGGAEAENFDRYLGVSLKVKESVRRWMVQKLPAFEEELRQEIDKAIEGALREARGERVEQSREGGKGKVCSDLLAVCIKRWRACRGICLDFVADPPSMESVKSVKCRFRKIVYLTTEELKDLVHRTESLPWQELLKKTFAEDEQNSQERNPGEGRTAEEILPAPLPFCDYPIIAGRM